MKKAFTIVELLVAMSLMAALIAVSAMAFAAAAKAYRTADASSEILVKLQGITYQLNADFAGLQKDMPLAIWSQYDPTTGRRYDQILFFADGDFQSVRQYDNDPTAAQNLITISGNAARIYYGQADLIDFANRTLADKKVKQNYWNANVLARRQHILTSDTGLTQFPVMDNINFVSTFVPFTLNGICNDLLEYDLCSMTDWKNALAVQQANTDQFLKTNFFTNLTSAAASSDSGRPGIDLSKIETLPSLMAQGVGSFAVQWYQGTSWFPDESSLNSIFGSDCAGGFYFNIPSGTTFTNWKHAGAGGFFPLALKFTFTLYDSRGVFPQGRTFTYIVYLGQ